MKRIIVCVAAALALLAMPKPVTAAQDSGIWIHNTTGYCVWVTVYTAGSQVRKGGFPNWVPANDKRLYPISWRGVGEEFRVRAEVLSTRACEPQNDAHPLQADIDTHVRGNLAYQVRLVHEGGRNFRFIRY